MPFVGTAADRASIAFDKVEASLALAEAGFETLPSLLLVDEQNGLVDRGRVRHWFEANQLDPVHGTAARCSTATEKLR